MADEEPKDETISSDDEEAVDDEEYEDMEEGSEEESEDEFEENSYEPENADGEKLICDESAYIMYHHLTTSSPCLSFDIIPDNLGDDRADKYPVTAYVAAGTQAEQANKNQIMVMKMSKMNRNKVKKDEKEDDSESESESDSDDEEDPDLQSALINHEGCINRIKVTFLGGRLLAATWSELGKVHIWNLSRAMQVVNNPRELALYIQKKESPKPLYTFSGHLEEGYAMCWSPTKPGVLVTGDCQKKIHLWKPLEAGAWHVEQKAYIAHTASVEDLQWSPNEENVLASCSSDQTIRVWDVRAPHKKACMITVNQAHDSDVNVIHWNKKEPFLLSGGDDGIIKVWDLRRLKQGSAIATFKHHTAPITSVEWHPTDSSVFAAAGSDDQVTLWDLAVEKDVENDKAGEDNDNLPPQLLFVHQGQKDIKELHWHKQMPGALITTALDGFNVFRTISV